LIAKPDGLDAWLEVSGKPRSQPFLFPSRWGSRFGDGPIAETTHAAVQAALDVVRWAGIAKRASGVGAVENRVHVIDIDWRVTNGSVRGGGG
jgi:hypothetical protein